MIPCQNCGRMLKKTAKFCGRCKTPTQKASVKKCQRCGEELEEDDQFCPECASPVTKQTGSGFMSVPVI